MGASRIANVTAAWLCGFGAGAGRARSERGEGGEGRESDAVATLFDDTLWIAAAGAAGAPAAGAARRIAVASARRDFVSGLARAIVEARAERVVVMPVESRASGAELALALVAWPERAVVAVDEGAAAPFCGIHRRAELLERARAALDETRPVPSLALFLSGLEVERLSLARLGLGEGPIAMPTVGEGR